MRRIYAVIMLLVLLSTPFETMAGIIYKWTDDNGVVIITNQPPPKGIGSLRVVSYPDLSAGSTSEVSPSQNQALQEGRQAKERLEEARREVEAAELQAKDAAKTAAEYSEKAPSRKRNKRIIQQRRARLNAETAGKTAAALLETQKRMAQAEAAAMAAEERIRETNSGAADGQISETGIAKGP